MFEFTGAWEMPINILFLAATGYIAWHGIRYRDFPCAGELEHGPRAGSMLSRPPVLAEPYACD